MKSFAEIQSEKLDGDYEIVAEATGQSPETVKKKVLGSRIDKGAIVQTAFNILLRHRKESGKLLVAKIKRELKARQS